jgi:hypothetical protein
MGRIPRFVIALGLALQLGACATSSSVEEDSDSLDELTLEDEVPEAEAQAEAQAETQPSPETPAPVIAAAETPPLTEQVMTPPERSEPVEQAETPATPPADSNLAATQTPPAGASSSVTRTRSGRNHSLPFYLQKRTTLALQLSGNLKNALGTETALSGGTTLSETRGGNLSLEFQPPWTQAIGVIGLGAQFSYYQNTAVTRLLGYGALASYQARFHPNQWVVPVVGYSMNTLNYQLTSGSTGTLSASGLTYGLRFFLSAADPGAAAELYNGFNVSRVYLTLESGTSSASNADLSLSGRTTSFGLRFEL